MGDGKAAGLLDSVGRLFREGTVAGLADAELLDRFVERGDATAIEILVERHGPMVWNTCRRRLRDRHEAEDAFQATFLILVRRVRSIRVEGSLGPWLHGVAWRVAERARVEIGRRRDREAMAVGGEGDHDGPERGAERRELAEWIDREVARLPPKYRAPIVLCDLQGLTQSEAARRLGCPLGTISIRLLRARARLRDRLASRGASHVVFPPSGTAPTRGAGSLSPLFTATIGLAGGSMAVPPTIERLTEGAIRAMFSTGPRRIASILAVLGGVTFLAGFALAARHDAPPATMGSPDDGVVSGRVVDEEGRAIPGARAWLGLTNVYPPLANGSQTIVPMVEGAETIADDRGEFTLAIPGTDEAARRAWSEVVVWVIAEGRSVGLAHDRSGGVDFGRGHVTVTLRRTTVTALRVLDPEGRPVAGAAIEPELLWDAQGKDSASPSTSLATALRGTTDERGLARLPAIERGRFAKVAIVTESHGRQVFSLESDASRPAERTLKLRRVGRLAGRIIADDPAAARGVPLVLTTSGSGQRLGEARVVTDERGRFGVPAIASGQLEIGEAYDRSRGSRLRLPEGVEIAPGGLNRITLAVDSATRVRGLVRSRATGRPLRGVWINVGSGAPQSLGVFGQYDRVVTDAEGRFEALALPGGATQVVTPSFAGFVQVGDPWTERVEVPEDVGVVDLPPIELVELGPPVSGTLVDAEDRPLAEALLLALIGERSYGQAVSDASGGFRFGRLPPGVTYSYRAPTAIDPLAIVGTPPLRLKVGRGAK